MPGETKSVLQQLRKTFKGRLSPIKLFDSNVCESTSPPGRPWESIPVRGQPFSRQLRFVHRERKVALVENDEYVSGSVYVEIPNRIFSVNVKEALLRHWISAEDFMIGDRSYPVYTQDGKLSQFEESLFRREEFTALIVAADIRDGESLHFSRSDVHFYLKTPTAEHVQRVIESAIELADKIEVLEEPLDLTSLPERFHALIPLIRKWAISDDEDRADLLGTASKAALKKMVEEVSPYFEEIGSYLATFGEKPPPEYACALGTLAECFVEAEQQIAKGEESD
jgi:hypothetical protein